MDQQTLRNAILSLARRYDFEEGHSLQDERLALRLFDETARLGLHELAAPSPNPLPRCDGGEGQGVGATPRDLLRYASLLHDIGYVSGYEEHHKTAFKLILAEPIPGLSPREQALVAHVARYHRGSLPDPAKHAAFASLAAEDQRLVAQLGAILRFADGLDRSHTNAVQDVRCTLDGNRLLIALLPGHGDEAERWAGAKKARWFEAVFGVQVEPRPATSPNGRNHILTNGSLPTIL
ncbi:MAG: HD domain-containing protein [Chloroflexi bacterium]|nr:HD domain-containing protein [Chloroflexota bacterium]